MFAIGRLNGNNLRFGSIDLTTSQMYTGMHTHTPFPWFLLMKEAQGCPSFIAC